MQEVAIHSEVQVLGNCDHCFESSVRFQTTADSLTATMQWLYNRRSELVGATGTQTHPYDYVYSYDSIGNRLTVSDGPGTIPYTANELNQYTSLYLRGETLLYDADGNLTQDNSCDFAYSYDDENRLVSVTPTNPVYGSRAIEGSGGSELADTTARRASVSLPLRVVGVRRVRAC